MGSPSAGNLSALGVDVRFTDKRDQVHYVREERPETGNIASDGNIVAHLVNYGCITDRGVLNILFNCSKLSDVQACSPFFLFFLFMGVGCLCKSGFCYGSVHYPLAN
jgi:hypothetical protein